jgi:D-galactarolactone isomerase
MEIPQLKVDAGACDCHVHIYEDRYPLAPTATFRPPHAPVSAYRQVQRALGTERVVVVQPTGYGFDNSCAGHALAQLGDCARGICVVPPDVSDAELARLHEAGFRGVRYMMLGALLSWESLPGMAARIAALGWVINLQLDGRELPQHAAMIGNLPGKVVIDHTGKFLEPVSLDSDAFKTLLRLLDNGRTWVKLSAPYETSRSGPPHYEDVSLLARALAKAHPDRCLWASNWPHPNRSPLPSDAAMLDLLLAWTDDAVTRRKMLVDNPAGLYGFAG